LLTIEHTFWEAREEPENFRLDGILKHLGEPDAELGAFDMGFSWYVYLKQGISILGNMPENYYRKVNVFLPMSLEKYQQYIWKKAAKNDR
jgi:hypothetical protein